MKYPLFSVYLTAYVTSTSMVLLSCSWVSWNDRISSCCSCLHSSAADSLSSEFFSVSNNSSSLSCAEKNELWYDKPNKVTVRPACSSITWLKTSQNRLFHDLAHVNLSHVITKPTKWVCAQRRLRSAWASAQSDQSLHYPYEESLGP